MLRVTSATFDGKLVGGMLSSVAGNGLKGAVVSAEGDVESDDGLASLDQVKVLLINASFSSGFVEEELDLFEETGFTVFIELGSELWLRGGKLTEDGGALSNFSFGDDGRKSLHFGGVYVICFVFKPKIIN